MSRKGSRSCSLILAQMTRVISSPSSSTMGFLTVILVMAAVSSLSFGVEDKEGIMTSAANLRPTASTTPVAEEGLRNVVATKSAICEVYGGDPERGLPARLIYRGYDINDLARFSTFEETTYLLWHGELPTKAQLAELAQQLEANRALPPPVIDLLGRFPRQSTPMDVLRTAVSALQLWD